MQTLPKLPVSPVTAAVIDDLLVGVAHMTTDAVLLTNAEGRVLWSNAAFERLTGYERSETVGAQPERLLAGTATDRLSTMRLHAALLSGESWRGEVQHYRKDGTEFWHEVTVSDLASSLEASPNYRLCIGRDVTERRTLARRFLELSSVMELSMDGIAVLDERQCIRIANGAFARLHGYATGAELEGRNWRSFYARAQLDVFDRGILQQLALHEQWHGEVTGVRADGSAYPQELTLSLLSGGMALVVRDITERVAYEEALHHLSLSDPLTGLYNRRGFMLLAQPLLTVATRQPGDTLLLYFDLNHFKPINDEFGHHVGDHALVEVAEILRATFRESDLIGRLGGDEFAVLAVNSEDPTGDVVLDRLDKHVAERNARGTRPYVLSIGRGVARCTTDAPQSLEHLLELADAEMLAGKRSR
ncbi:MAG: diguanylate cyclase [Cytophagaceae bacterium]|nr:diguanylate cyclase [Gemmatimonadaceae bacterium]